MRCATILMAGCMLGLLPGPVRAGAVDLRAQAELWEKKVFVDAADGVGEACAMGIVSDPEKGECLAVGPWRAGKWGVRMQYGRRLPVTRGVVRGFYRTEGLPSRAVELSVQFFKGSERLGRRSLRLAASEQWRPFEMVLWAGPQGADGCVPGFGLAAKGTGRVLFSGLSIGDALPELDFATPAITRPAPAAFAPGKFHRLEKSGEAWWLVTPQGQAFYSLGVDGASLTDDEAGLRKGLQAAQWMAGHGFNSLGGWSNMSRWAKVNQRLIADGRPPVAGFCALESAKMKGEYDRLMDARGIAKDGDHGFADPFDPRYEQVYRARVKQVAAAVRGQEWFVAWFADNEISHAELHRYVYSPHCGRQFVAFLKERHADVAALNAAWKTAFASFDDVLAQKPEPGALSSRRHDDFRAFARVIIRHYAALTLRIIREEDPGRLVFSNRFMLGEFAAIDDLLDLYSGYDGVGANLYPANQQAGLSEDERALLARIHQKTGRPILLTEWSVPALDSGLYNNAAKLDWSWDEAVPTQSHRAQQAGRVTADFYNLPFLVGAHWFTWRDFDSEKRQANRGLMRVNGEPWAELAEALKDANGRVSTHVQSPSQR